MNRYVIGTAVIGASSDDFGPGTGGTHYADPATIMTVQMQLKRMGYYNGSITGTLDAATEKALFIVTGQHGPPDDAALAKIGVRAGGGLVAPAGTVPAPTSGTPGAKSPPSMMTASFWAKPLWQNAPVKRWQAALGGLGGLTLAIGIVSAVRK